MASPRKVGVSLLVDGYVDLSKHEIRNAQLQNLSSDPATPVLGQMYYHTTNIVPMFYNGATFVAQMSGGTQTFAGAKTFSTALASPGYGSSGQTGAAVATKYAGGTASGAPGSGTFTTGDFIVTTGGDLYVCSSGGTPGTWVRVGSYLLGANNTWSGTNAFNAAVTGSGTVTMTNTIQGTQVIATGQTGAATSTKYAGGNASGAPGSGTFATGDWTVTTGGDLYICTAGGTPGTWARVGSYLLAATNSWVGANTFTGGVIVNTIGITGNKEINLTGTGTSSLAGILTATIFSASGNTGATAGGRFAGATASGAPASGTYLTGDFVIDRSGSLWICTTGGTPGTWAQLTSSALTASGTVTSETSYGISSTAGAAGTYSRGDHTHGSPSLSTNPASTQAFADSATNGTGTLPAKDDHKHGWPSLGTVSAQTTFGASSANGSAVTPSRSDHQHGTPTHIGTDHSAISHSALSAPTADISWGGFKITSLGTPTAATDAANKGYVDGVSQGLDFKTSVRVATTTNAALATAYENTDTIDGTVLATGDRILIKDQTTASENGIYIVSVSGAPVRASDADASGEISNGALMYVETGTANGNQLWVCTATGATPWVPGTSTSTWSLYWQLTSVQTGAGLIATADVIAVGQGTGIIVNADDVAIDTALVVRKYSTDIGNGALTALPVTHSLGTKDVIVTCYDNTTPFAEIDVDVEHTSTSVVTLNFTTAPTSNQYRVTVHA